jgi:hypothetical protein
MNGMVGALQQANDRLYSSTPLARAPLSLLTPLVHHLQPLAYNPKTLAPIFL